MTDRVNKSLLIAIALIIVLAFLGFLWLSSDQPQEKNTQESNSTEESNLTKEESSAEIKTAVIQTNLGDIEIELFEEEAPQTVANFIKLAEDGFYNGVKFHRVIPGFMIQTGDPNSKDDDWSDDGTGGPGYVFDDEINQYKLIKGSVAMANRGPNTNGSQFFIVTAQATPWLDGKHTNFGYVIDGMTVVSQIEKAQTNAQDHPLKDIVIENIYVD